MKKIILLLALITTFSPFADSEVCLINTHYPRIQINGDTIIDEGGMFDKCEEMDCLIKTAKNIMSVGQCTRIEIGEILTNESRECLIHSHYPRIVRNDKTIYDGGGWGDKFDNTNSLIDLAKQMQEVGVCSSIRID